MDRPQLSMTLRSFSATGRDSWDHLFDQASEAEDAGVDRLVVSDHVVFGSSLDDYARPELGGRADGRQPTGPDGHWLEPLTVLSAVAARTRRVRLGTSILLAALRRPVVLAKTLATVDVLSGGRVDLGVGVGWQRAEYDAAGLRFEARGRLLDDTLAYCQELWRHGVADLPTGRVHQQPQPLQAGGIPIWVGGRATNPRVVERIVRHGSGWIPWDADGDDPRPGLALLRTALEAAGRGEDRLQVTVALPDSRAEVLALVAAGVTDFRVSGSAVRASSLHEVVDRFRTWTS